ncbi:MAG: hypothetical protein KBC73_06990 [Burkholderiaceae bacterium]|nr:hypothetical protein [Burkholderiaceae bacterium]
MRALQHLFQHLPGLAIAAALCGLAAPLSAQGTYQLSAYARAHADTTQPVPGLGGTDHHDVDLLNQPSATQLQRLDSFASTVHGSATARFLGRIGLLKAYAASDYAYCCSGGFTLQYGYADATVQARFYDELRVQGAGLADGTPVSYRLELHLSGTLSQPGFEIGGRYSADALAEAGLRDLSSGAQASLSWDARRQSTGVYELRLDTVVGHTLAISGMLYAGTYVAAGALVARSAEVDFYHSAGYVLVPSVPGLNTLSASGHDFAVSAVPEPGRWMLLLAGALLLLPVVRSRPRRRGLLAAGLALGMAATAQAGRAQAGATLGTWADWDLAEAQVGGSSWRDGLLLQTVAAAATPFNDAASAGLQVDGVASNAQARVRLQGSAGLRQPGTPALLGFAGGTDVASDLLAGTLNLAFDSSRAAYGTASGALRQGYIAAYAYAELFETFELVMPIDRLAPVQVALDLRIDGRLEGGAGDNGQIGGVQAYLQLAGVDTGESHAMLDAVWRSEHGVAGALLGYGGELDNRSCNAVSGLCSGFVHVYAALDLRGRSLASGEIGFQPGAPMDLDFGARLSLTVSPGVTLLRIGGVNEPLPAVAWAGVSAVPEPAAWTMALAGLLGLVGLGLFRRCGPRAA